MILALFFHLFSTYFMKAYRAPRELTWLTGLGLMVLAMAFGFTGYLLPWDEVSFFATKIGLDITSKLPLVGHLMVQILQGGADVSQATLTRFFLIHVILLPLGFLGLLGLHLAFVQSHGMSEPEDFNPLPDGQKQYEKFFPDFALKDAMVWLLTLNVLATLVTLFPWGLGPEADPFAPAPQGIKPEWYFLAMFQFLKIIPARVGPFEGEMLGLGFFSLIGLTFAITPFLDEGKSPTLSTWATRFGQLVCIGFVVFTIWGFLA
jgi:cytochrome b6